MGPNRQVAMLLQRISCETAQQCNQLATAQQELVLGGIVIVLLLVVVWQLSRVYQHTGLEG